MTPGAPRLVLGDEELLVARAVATTIAEARAAQPRRHGRGVPGQRDVGGRPDGSGQPGAVRRPAGRGDHGGQDARKELAAALLSYAAAPEPDVTLVVTHAGGAKGKALADGLREAGAPVTNAAKLTRHRERVEFVREEIRRLGGKCGDDAAEALIAAVGTDLRELAAACQQLVADTDGRIDAATVARYYRGRAEVSGYTVADAVMVGNLPAALEALRWALLVGVDPVPIADALADGVRTVSRVASAGSRQRLPGGQHARHAAVEGGAGPAPGPRLVTRVADAGHADRGRVQRGREGWRGGSWVRPGAGGLRPGLGPRVGWRDDPQPQTALSPPAPAAAAAAWVRCRPSCCSKAQSWWRCCSRWPRSSTRGACWRSRSAVAVMVKLNDVIIVVLRRPAAAAQLDRPRLAGGPAIGVSARPSTAHLTTWISGDDAVADPAARPEPARRPVGMVWPEESPRCPTPIENGSGPAPASASGRC